MDNQIQMMKKILDLSYEEKHNSHQGRIIIKSQILEPELLGQLWAAGPRDHICRRLYGVDVAGCFISNSRGYIDGRFFLNFVDQNGDDIKGQTQRKKYMKTFEETFSRQMILFQEVLESFLLDDENGYLAYIDLLESGKIVKPEDTIKFFRKFMRKINIRTAEDDKASAKKAAEIAKRTNHQ